MKTLFIKLGLFIVLLIVANGIYKHWFYETDIQKHAEIVNLIREIPLDTDVLYLGESSNNTFRSEDLDKRAISDFIGDHFPTLHVYDVTKPAAHVGVYRVLINHIPEEARIKTMVVTLNLRSFNAQWIYSDLETALQKSLVLLKPYPALFNRFVLSFRAYDNKTKEEREKQYKNKWRRDVFNLPFDFPHKNVEDWDAYVWKNGVKNEDGEFDDDLKALVCHYIKAFAFQIDTLTNPRIHDFDAIVEFAKKRNIRLVFNLLAENTEKAQDLAGDVLVYMMHENAKLLEQYYTKRGVLVVNNLDILPNESFIDQDWTTEHYDELGRKTIAQKVALALKPWYPTAYKAVDLSSTYQLDFFNDCEAKTPWSQTHTISTEMAFSGKKSSLVWYKNDCSITLEYPLKYVPDSLKNELFVSLMFHQNSYEHDAILVIEAKGENTENYWSGFKLNEFQNKIGEWSNFSKRIPMDSALKNADLIKIYVYNPTKHKLYIDDFLVKIER